MTIWEKNAHYCEETFGTHVDWEERFYDCPDCGEPVYECDWQVEDLVKFLCPICEFVDEEAEEDLKRYDYEDDVDETGYNPYMGCYDYDC